LGGSTTEDLSNEEGIHWPLIAEEGLHRRGRTDARIYNGAMSAYTSAHTLVRLQFDVLQYDPDVVLIMDNVNDLSVVYRAWRQRRVVDGNYLVKYGSPGYTGGDDGLVLSRVVHSISSRVAALAAAPAPPPDDHYDIEKGRALFKRNLRSQVSVARAHGVVPVLLTMPVCESDSVYATTHKAGGDPRDWPPDYHRFLADFDTYNQAIRDVAAELGVAVIDLRREVPGVPENFMDVVHHSSAGARAIGEVVARELTRILPPRAARRER
jgi:lysophospholipase L1-like esterase